MPCRRQGSERPLRPGATVGGGEPERRYDRVHGVEVFSVAAGPEAKASAAVSAQADVVLVHGLAVSHRYLVPCLRRLASERRVFAPDLPGVGRSSRPPRRPSLSQLADAVADWMDAVGVGSASVIGHSLGCQVVALLAARHPARVTAVVLVSPGGDPDQRSLWRQAWRLVVDAPRERPSMVLIAVADYLKVGAVRMLCRIREARRSDATANLTRIQQPTLVVRGDRDPLVSPQWAQQLARTLPSGELATIAEAPHGVPYSAVEPFVATVRGFLATVERRERDV